MMDGDEYRERAVEFLTHAGEVPDPEAAVLRDLSSLYLELAELADAGAPFGLARKIADVFLRS